MANEDIAAHVAANVAAAEAHMAFLVACYELKMQAKVHISGKSSSHEEDDSGSSTPQDDKHDSTSAEEQPDDDMSQLDDDEVPDLVNSEDEDFHNGGTGAKRFNYHWVPVQSKTCGTMQEVEEIYAPSTPEWWPPRGVTDYEGISSTFRQRFCRCPSPRIQILCTISWISLRYHLSAEFP